MISREMIISYLTEYSAIEEIFRTYYEQDGKVNSFYDMEKKYAFFMKEGSRFLQRKKELDEKYPKKILDLDNVDLDAWEKENVQKNMDHEIKEKNRVHFLHKEFFETDKNIFINKHIRFSPGEFHDHEFIEMCYIYRGKVDQFLRSKEGKVEKKETLNQGNLLIIPPGMQHKVNIYDDSMMINIVVNKYTFEKTFLGDIPQQSLLHQFFSEVLFSQESNAYVVFSGGNDEVLRDKLLDLMVAYLNETTYGARICDHYLSIFFLELLGQCKNVKLSSRLGKEGEQMTQILLYINHNYASISLEEVAEEFHYSKTYLNRIFKKHMGTTILKQIQDTRLQESCLLLKNTRMSVEDIALHVGYEDTSYFIELFKKKYKKTPLQYRNDID